MRVFETVANARLRAEMDDGIECLAIQRLCQRGVIGKVELPEDETPAGAAFDIGNAVLLQRDLIIIVEIVDPQHFVAARAQRLGYRSPDEAGRTGN